MNFEKAMELADSLFSFDYVGDAMIAVRRDLDNELLQNDLAGELIALMISQTGDAEDAIKAVYAEAAKARVQQFVKSAKASAGTGCGK